MLRTLVIFAAITFCGCGPTTTDLGNLKPLVETLQEAGIINVFEGLPHQQLDAEHFAQQQNSAQTVGYGGFPFYAGGLEISRDDRAAVLQLFGSTDSFEPHDLTAAKACGGFHPDYCLVWRAGSDTCYALLCFGCDEIKAACSDRVLHADIRRDVVDEFEAILGPYAKHHTDAR